MLSVVNPAAPVWTHRWWTFPFAAVLFLTLVTIVASASARADAGSTGPAKGKGLPAGIIDQGGLYLPSSAAGRVRAAPLVGTEITVDVSGLIARTRVTQHFKNPTGQWTEAVYTHPLPPDSAVDKMTLTVGGRVTEGQIAERKEARRQYTAAKRSGRRASLLEQQRPNIFTTAVANLGPHEKVSVTIEFQERLTFRHGQFALRLPLVVGPRYVAAGAAPVRLDAPGGRWARPAAVPDAEKISPPLRSEQDGPGNPVTLKVAIAAGFEIGRISSPTHDIVIDGNANGHAAVRLSGDAQPADSDFVLRWAPADAKAPQAGFFFEKSGGQGYGLLMVMPPVSGGRGLDLPRSARDVTFIIDTSGSMHGASMSQAKQGLTLALDRLRPMDRFAIFAFSDKVTAFARGLTKAEPAAVALAKQFVGQMEAEGGTEIARAVAAALGGSRDADRDAANRRLRQVVLITDGAVGDEARLFDLIDRDLGGARLFTVGIGSAPNGYLMTRAAQAGRGTHTFIQGTGEVAERMAELFLKLENPALTDVELTWSGTAKNEPPEVWPKALPDLYAGEPLIALIKLTAAEPHVRVSGRIGGKVWEQTVTITGGGDHRGIAALWGREKIRRLTASMRGLAEGPREAIRDEIVRTALDLGLISKYTSLVAIDREAARPAGAAVANKDVPVNLPRGWRRTHIESPGNNAPQPAQAGPQKTQSPYSAPAMAPRPVATLAFDRTDPALSGHLAAAVAGTPLIAMPRTATPAGAYMALGILFLLAALALLIMGWREPDAVKDAVERGGHPRREDD